jgi:hypothetical protein
MRRILVFFFMATLAGCTTTPMQLEKASDGVGFWSEAADAADSFKVFAKVNSSLHELDKSAAIIRASGETCSEKGFPFFDISKHQMSVKQGDLEVLQAQVFCFRAPERTGLQLPPQERELPDRALLLGPDDLEHYRSLVR